MSVFYAYYSGVAAFFSIWLFCLLQIIPFFLALIVGMALSDKETGGSRPVFKAFAVALVSFAGFIFIFTSMGLVSTALSKVIFNSLSLGNQIGGVVTGVIGLYLLGLLSFDGERSPVMTAVRHVSVFLFGSAVALAYKPCVTPALTQIYKIASSPASAGEGAVLLMAYSLGVATVISAGGLLISWAVAKVGSLWLETSVKRLCGVVLLVIAGLILTGNMTVYKSFLVGRFVPDAPSVAPVMKPE
jgi:cytochrome c-type biogenesis protein